MSILSGIKIIEIEGIGPGPFCGMQLADLGADIILIQRPTPQTAKSDPSYSTSVLNRGKRIIQLNLKDPQHQQQVKELLRHADGLIEGMRPGVMERLGLGPEICLKQNPKLVYGRVTGWGQTGPLAQSAGHDLNYIGLSSALWYSGRPGDAPVAPPTLIGDIGGGALHLTIGMLAAIFNAYRTGKGDVIDAAMIDGSANMMNLLFSSRANGRFSNERGKSLLDGPHWYDSYQCSDNKFVTIGALEPKFYQLLLSKLGLSADKDFADQLDSEKWPVQKDKLSQIISQHSQSHWCGLLEGSDACFAPVLDPDQAANHPHNRARQVFSTRNDNLEANPAPRFRNHPFTTPDNARVVTCDEVLGLWSSQAQVQR
ncbi:MAG: CaiB/BaiF CoA-transferase family protein [Porticoccaceae bacterium]|jgi:acetyl-CoA hydrolase|nr:CaiB/BaiF CoA-transferase family protein [Porticoccaceae bacterium]MDG1446452.1 CaiB/BaiF CoA-transferase family protein [Porticoccaceae bacterium]